MTEFLQLVVAGIALGAQYALIGLGFVIIFRGSGVLNFAQGGFVALGAYLTYAAASTASLPFAVAAVAAVTLSACAGAATERIVLRRMVGQPIFAVIMITIGLLLVLEQLITVVWGHESLNLGDPWGVETVTAGGVVISEHDIWTVALAAAALAGFFVFFRASRVGLAMRAVAFDQEAALAQGISVRRIVMVSWAISGALAAVAGITLAAGPAALSPSIGAIVLVAFPAMIVGGLDSPGGAVAGGLIIGVTQSLTAGYQGDVLPWAGDNVAAIVPYVVMIAILLVRPHGLFGTPEVRRL